MGLFLLGAMWCEYAYLVNHAAAIKRHKILHELLRDDWHWHAEMINAVYPY